MLAPSGTDGAEFSTHLLRYGQLPQTGKKTLTLGRTHETAHDTPLAAPPPTLPLGMSRTTSLDPSRMAHQQLRWDPEAPAAEALVCEPPMNRDSAGRSGFMWGRRTNTRTKPGERCLQRLMFLCGGGGFSGPNKAELRESRDLAGTRYPPLAGHPGRPRGATTPHLPRTSAPAAVRTVVWNSPTKKMARKHRSPTWFATSQWAAANSKLQAHQRATGCATPNNFWKPLKPKKKKVPSNPRS